MGCKPPPEEIRVCLGLIRENLYVTIGEATWSYELSEHPIDRVMGSSRGRKAPAAENKTFWIEFKLKDAIPEVEALKLLKEIYHWFGITDERIPYVDSTSVPARIDRACYS